MHTKKRCQRPHISGHGISVEPLARRTSGSTVVDVARLCVSPAVEVLLSWLKPIEFKTLPCKFYGKEFLEFFGGFLDICLRGLDSERLHNKVVVSTFIHHFSLAWLQESCESLGILKFEVLEESIETGKLVDSEIGFQTSGGEICSPISLPFKPAHPFYSANRVKQRHCLDYKLLQKKKIFWNTKCKDI